MTEYASYETNKFNLNNKYRFIRKLQDGSFGKVSLAVDISTNTEVLIKAIPKLNNVNAAPSEKSSIEIAHNEISILSELKGNLNICQLLESFETDDHIILVLEYCSKGDLYDLVHSRTLTISEILKLSTQLCNAIEFCHSLNIYHRDLKPENILIDAHDNFKLCDWGLATKQQFSDEFNVGTEKYMAPECFIRHNSCYLVDKYDCKYADYWSFGITLLTAIFRTCPFKQSGSSSIQSDYNFKNFVFYNNPQILYDIYPIMNSNCFDIFSNLLKVGNQEDDASTFKEKLQARDLKRFVADLDKNWIYGLSVDDEFDEYDELTHHNNNLFDMDHDDLQDSKTFSSYEFIDEPVVNNDMHQYTKTCSTIPITNSPRHQSSSKSPYRTNPMSMVAPSLVESSMKSTISWCDLDDEEFGELDLLVKDLTIDPKPTPMVPTETVVDLKSTDDHVKVFEHELFMNNDTKVINWFDH